MINFCCVYYGTKYKVEYVQKLYNMIQRHLTIPHKFICFTDNIRLNKMVEGDIECKPFHYHNYQGWWNKLQLFSPEVELEGVNFYLDLDVVLLDSIDKFVEYGNEDSFCITRDFSYSDRMWNSSVMKWNNKTATDLIWKPFLANKTQFMSLQGDQNVISDCIRDKDNCLSYPDEWTFSYKWRSRIKPAFSRADWTFEQVPGASIAVFHGSPNPHESDQDWVKNNWI